MDPPSKDRGWTYSDFVFVGGERVALVEDIETSTMELVEILGVVFAHEGDLVEREHYGVVESHGERLGNAGKVDGMGGI